MDKKRKKYQYLHFEDEPLFLFKNKNEFSLTKVIWKIKHFAKPKVLWTIFCRNWHRRSREKNKEGKLYNNNVGGQRTKLNKKKLSSALTQTSQKYPNLNRQNEMELFRLIHCLLISKSVNNFFLKRYMNVLTDRVSRRDTRDRTFSSFLSCW